jgi:hypothetical protein
VYIKLVDTALASVSASRRPYPCVRSSIFMQTARLCPSLWNTHTYTYTHTHSLTHTHTHTHAHTNSHTYTYTHTHIHMHTQTHTLTHTHTNTQHACTLLQCMRTLPHFRYGCCHTSVTGAATLPLRVLPHVPLQKSHSALDRQSTEWPT